MPSLTLMELVIAIKRVPLFVSVHGEGLKRLADVIREKPVKAGEIVFAEGDLGEEVYLVHEGAVTLYHVVNGREAHLFDVEVGGYFGELAIIDELPRSASARAKEDAVLLVMNKKDFRTAVQDYPDIAFEVLRELSRRLRTADERFKNYVETRAGSRVDDS